MADRKRGRPPKPESERLFPLCTNLSQADYEEVCRRAKVQRVPPAQLVREWVAELLIVKKAGEALYQQAMVSRLSR